MSERWGDNARDRAMLDAWITREPQADDPDYGPQFDEEELDPLCGCGLLYTDHESIQVTDEEGGDYETYVCAKCFVCGVPLTMGRAHAHTLEEVVSSKSRNQSSTIVTNS